MESYRHVTIVTADFNSELFTRHGLHMNNQGKEMTAKQIAATKKKWFQSLCIGRIIIMILITMEYK
jgi:hypothetical protein